MKQMPTPRNDIGKRKRKSSTGKYISIIKGFCAVCFCTTLFCHVYAWMLVHHQHVGDIGQLLSNGQFTSGLTTRSKQGNALLAKSPTSSNGVTSRSSEAVATAVKVTAVKATAVTAGSNRWQVVSVTDYGAIGDNITDNSHAFQAAFRAIADSGGEVIVPSGGVFQTTPFNMTSNSVLTVQKYATIRGVADQHKFPILPALYSYGRDTDMSGLYRRQSLIHAHHVHNITLRGEGIVDGAGWYWYPFFHNFTAAYNIGRPHLVEFNNCTDIEITQITLKDPAFWTLHPVYCTNVYIHHMRIEAPSCRNYGCANTDGIDIDSSQNVLVEYNTLNVGDDHVTVLAGKRRNIYIPPSRNVTVQHNTLGSGMGLCIGSSTAGGVEDVLYYNNTMRAETHTFGAGVHIKLRERFGGYVRNIRWIDNTFYVAGKPGGAIVIEGGYQSGGAWKKQCTNLTGFMPCPEVRDILIRNLTVHHGNPGRLNCYAGVPCENITLEHVYYPNDAKAKISCQNVHSGRQNDTYPEHLLDPETCLAFYDKDLSLS